MLQSREIRPEKPCDICGDFGFVESLSTCFQCNMACEHIYCMQTNCRDVPKVWFCEPCRLNNGIVSPKSGTKERLLKASISDSFGTVSQENEDSTALFPSKMVCHDALSSVGPSILPGDAEMWFPCEMQRAVETAKVNILPAEEAITLSSGAKTKASPLWGGLGSRTGPSDTVPSISRSLIVSATAPPKWNANPSSRPSIHSEPLTLGSVQTSTTLQQRAVQNSKPLKDGESPRHFPSKCSTSERFTNIKVEEDRPGISFAPAVESELSSCKVLSQTDVRSVDAKHHSPSKHIGVSEPKSGIHGKPYEGRPLGLDKAAHTVDSPLRKEAPAVPRNHFVCKEEPIDAVMSAKEVGTSNAKMERAVNKVACASSPPMESLFISSSGGTFCTDGKPKTFDVQERDLPRVLPEFDKYLPNPPSQDATWEGSFEILDAVPPGKFYDGFLAHPPGVVSRKAYEFSKKMPGVLKFKAHPRCDVWPEIFQMDCPGGHDIAMYFFPGDFERSKQMYVCLLELIEMHDLVMRSCFDGVELLITTSKHLHVDFQRLNMQFYLWGVYRRVKGSKSFYKEHGLFSSYVSPTGRLHKGHPVLREDSSEGAITNNKGNTEVVDMEIDMIGGKDVGRFDRPVPRHILLRNEVQFKPQIPNEMVQFKPQEFFTSSNALELYNINKSYKRGWGRN